MSRTTALVLWQCACVVITLLAAAPALAQRVPDANPLALAPEPPSNYRCASIEVLDDLGLDAGLALWVVSDGGALPATLLPDGTYFADGLEAKVTLEFQHPLYGRAQLPLNLGDSKFCQVSIHVGPGGATLHWCAGTTYERAVYELKGNAPPLRIQGSASQRPGPGSKLSAMDASPFEKALDLLGLPCFPGDGDESDAPIVVGDGVFTGDLADNTGTIDLDSSAFNNTIDEWLCYSASCTGEVTVTTCLPGTRFDTVLSVWTDGVEISANDDTLGAPPECTLGGLERFSTVLFKALAGEVYQIRVSAFNDTFSGLGAWGTRYELSIECAPFVLGGSNCCSENGGLGCDDDDCEATVCAIDPWCCVVSWDGNCGNEAQDLCEVCDGGDGDCVTLGGDDDDGGDDCCSGDGDVCTGALQAATGDNFGDTTDDHGSDVPSSSCALNDWIDEWWCWTAPCDGIATASTCNQADFDTTIVIYEACGGSEVTCNDDYLGCADFTALVVWPVTAGTEYKIRVAGFDGEIGTYTLTLSCDTEVPSDCCFANEGVGCEDLSCTSAVCAVDPFCCLEGWDSKCAGEAVELCSNLCGDACPGSECCFAPHVTPGCDNEECCEAVCALSPFCCDVTWDVLCAASAIEICETETGACCFGGGLSGSCNELSEVDCQGIGGIFLGEATTCAGVDCEPPDNDECANAIHLELDVVVSGSTTFANTDVNAPSCLAALITAPGVWYSVTGTGTTLAASTCNMADFDTKISVYCGECGDGGSGLTCVAGVDDTPGCDSGTSLVTWCSEAGVEYLILVHGYGVERGDFDLTVYDANDLVCVPTVLCDEPGACCLCEGTNLSDLIVCVEATSDGCDSLGGTFRGEGSSCGGATGVYDQAVGTTIPDGNPTGISSTINVPDTLPITDVNVDLTIEHLWVGDLCVELEHGGTTVRLIQRPGANPSAVSCYAEGPFGCSEDNYVNIILDDEGGGGSIEDACALNLTSPPNYTPFDPLSDFDGQNSSGAWTLTVIDNAAGFGGGIFVSWSLHFEDQSESPCDANCGGGCCLPDSGCQNTADSIECAALNGTFQGAGTNCADPIFCPVVPGACCFPNGSCQSSPNSTTCADAGGAFQGNGTSCFGALTVICPILPGACCFQDGSCVSAADAAACEGLTGTFQGHGTNCGGVVCPIVPAACCFPDGSCQSSTNASACESAGGVFMGHGTNCPGLTVICPILPGACCLPDGTCLSSANASACAASGGVFQGHGTNCAGAGLTVTCPILPGACCFPNGSCQSSANASACAGSGGVFQGHGTNCATLTVTCPILPGACCFPNGTCQSSANASACAASGGVFQGHGTNCAGAGLTVTCPVLPGACCFPNGSCQMKPNASVCTGAGGVFQGHGTNCGGVTCPVLPGACCFPNGSCQSAPNATACTAAGGVFQGHGTNCASLTVTCPVLPGACCLDDGTCIVTDANDCLLNYGGVFQGHGTNCASVTCPQPSACCLCHEAQQCIEVVVSECPSFGGTFLGEGTSCNDEYLGPGFNPCIEVCCVLIEFEQKEDGTPLPNGAVLNNSFWPSLFTIQSSGFNAGPAVFDSTPGGPNQNSDDPDLLVNTGNIGILQNNLHAGQTGGIFNSPDDDSTPGGVLRFNFVHLVQVRSVDLIDIDEGGACTVKLFDDNGKTRTYNVQDFFTTSNQGGIRTLDLTILGVQQGVDGNAVGTQQSGFNEHRVVRLDFNFGGSAAIDNLIICLKENSD